MKEEVTQERLIPVQEDRLLKLHAYRNKRDNEDDT